MKSAKPKNPYRTVRFPQPPPTKPLKPKRGKGSYKRAKVPREEELEKEGS